MTPECIVSPRARKDFQCICHRLEELSPRAAANFTDEFLRKISLLADFPQLGVARPDIGPHVRSLPIESYTIYYRALPGATEISAILRSGEAPKPFLDIELNR